jgi:quercetin dioxygenase-like cupin family protein
MSDNPQVNERTPQPPVTLPDLGASMLDEARAQANGRAAVTLTPGEGGPLTQTVLAIEAGHELSEHTTPGPATLQVLKGVATLTVDGDETRLPLGAWTPIPRDRHGLRAEEDLVALLTVVPNP